MGISLFVCFNLTLATTQLKPILAFSWTKLTLLVSACSFFYDMGFLVVMICASVL